MKKTTSNKSRLSLSIFIGMLLLCFYGFYNGFPFIYPDTGTYIKSGFQNIVPYDRTIFYGLFIRHISLANSLWLVVFVQGLIVSWIINLTIGIFYEGIKRSIISLSAITFLVIFTGISINVSILIPDIFSAISILVIINLFYNSKLLKYQKIILYILFVFSLASHLSNIATYIVILLVLILITVIQYYRKKGFFLPFHQIRTLGILVIVSTLIVPTTHYLIGQKFQFSKGSHVFMINRLIENGLLEQYLNDACKEENYSLCEYKDQLSWNFIWDDNSVLHKTGGWENSKEEYNRLLFDFYTSPKYWPDIILKGGISTLIQCFTFETTLHAPLKQGSAPYGEISWHYKESEREYLSSKQNNNKLNFDFLHMVESPVILVSSLIIFLGMFYYSSEYPELNTISLIILIYGVINAFICANVSTVDPRFTNKWIWILPMLALLYILQWKKQKTVSSTN